MHIVDSTLFFAPHSGGVKRYLLAKQRHVCAQPGWRHTLLVPGPCNGNSPPGIELVAAPRIPFAGGYRLPWRLGQWRDALCRLEPDLIEVADPYHLSWAALAAAQRLGIPAIAFAHSHVSRLFANRFGRWTGKAVDAYLRGLYRRFDAVLAPSHLVADHLAAIGVDQVAVQPLGVDANIFHPSAHDPDLRALLGLPGNTRLLAFAGRMAREKSIPLMCRAVDELGAPYHLLLVGARERRRVSAGVTTLPYCQDARRLARLLASADALLHAGAQETFGLVFLEAMACGRPVIGVSAGAVPELVHDDVGLLAEPGNVESLQHAIVSLYERDLARLGACARARVEHGFTWEHTFNSLTARYAQQHHAHRAPAGIEASRAS